MPRSREETTLPSAQLMVRRATPADLETLTLLGREIFGMEAHDIYTFRQLLDISRPLAFVATVQGRHAGYAIVAPTWEARCAWLLTLGVVPDYRRQGIGRKLMGAVVQGLTRLNVSEIKLTVEPYNENAKNLYASMGFVCEGNCADYFGPGQDRFLMRLSL